MAAGKEGIDLGDDADVVADMHARGLPIPVCMATLEALIAARRAASAVSYRVVLRPAAVRALQRMPEKISAACWEFIHGPLAENPHRVGKPLLEPLAPQYSARRGEYRVLYLIEDEQVTIIITSVTHRADLYRTRWESRTGSHSNRVACQEDR